VRQEKGGEAGVGGGGVRQEAQEGGDVHKDSTVGGSRLGSRTPFTTRGKGKRESPQTGCALAVHYHHSESTRMYCLSRPRNVTITIRLAVAAHHTKTTALLRGWFTQCAWYLMQSPVQHV
jgi:hypothetical protein